jgi:hypothetical protein
VEREQTGLRLWIPDQDPATVKTVAVSLPEETDTALLVHANDSGSVVIESLERPAAGLQSGRHLRTYAMSLSDLLGDLQDRELVPMRATVDPPDIAVSRGVLAAGTVDVPRSVMMSPGMPLVGTAATAGDTGQCVSYRAVPGTALEDASPLPSPAVNSAFPSLIATRSNGRLFLVTSPGVRSEFWPVIPWTASPEERQVFDGANPPSCERSPT